MGMALVGKGDSNGFASESTHLLSRQHNNRFERSRAAYARRRFVGPAYRGTYSGSVTTSMPEPNLDECRSYLPVMDRTARQHALHNNAQTDIDRGGAAEISSAP
jgi:hypothetical protein